MVRILGVPSEVSDVKSRRRTLRLLNPVYGLLNRAVLCSDFDDRVRPCSGRVAFRCLGIGWAFDHSIARTAASATSNGMRSCSTRRYPSQAGSLSRS
jgi:hypothetical protein